MANCFVTTVDLALASKLRDDLEVQGFVLSVPPYTLFAAHKKGLSCTLYTSGKLMVQGKGKEEFITFYLEPEILGNLSYSYPTAKLDLTPHIGVDETGKGDFFGPLCIAAVYADGPGIETLVSMGMRDSKKISDAKIHVLAKQIQERFAYSLVRLMPPKYNELYESFRNLNSLLAWGHATAIAELTAKTGCTEVLIDQFASEQLVINALQRKQITVHLTQRHRAEADPVVAAASIVARSCFLRGLEDLSRQFQLSLPKGAADQVIVAGRSLVAQEGIEALRSAAKLHFKTYDQVINP